MTDQTALWILLPALGVLLLTAVATMVWPTSGSRAKHRDRQRARLRAVVSQAHGSTLEVDWLGYGEITKSDLVATATHHGWRLHAEDISPQSWRLRFTRSPTAGPRDAT